MNSKFEYSLLEKGVINRPIDVVYKALHDVKDWDKKLPHIREIKVLYDDNEYQEFLMSVSSENGSTISVRSVRQCNNHDAIRYFQPNPPVFLKHHSGSWKINKINEETCEVEAQHFWDINNEVLSESSNGIYSVQKIDALLREHARFAIQCWKSILEGNH